MAPHAYGKILADNIRAARGRAGIGQESLAERMRGLGFDAWIRQTVGATERGRRRPVAEEILGLAVALDTTVMRLMSPLPEDKGVELPSGLSLGAFAADAYVTGERITDERIMWSQDDKPFRNPPVGEYRDDGGGA